ncbi:6733_t:CDS:2 [Cetraspora pellucida]|uniref:6733_t:CDS:1 n=1 Tax=Cetraspora pellucida TaxID=1433469 RepID=A0A9N9EJS0_9GLOM|nr:6733_t:CDS:2 [Cetraspora pellucida]
MKSYFTVNLAQMLALADIYACTRIFDSHRLQINDYIFYARLYTSYNRLSINDTF